MENARFVDSLSPPPPHYDHKNSERTLYLCRFENTGTHYKIHGCRQKVYTRSFPGVDT
jgi:hypothetical protein